MWLGPELNRRHADFQSAALPTELPSRCEPSLKQKTPHPQTRLNFRGNSTARLSIFKYRSRGISMAPNCCKCGVVHCVSSKTNLFARKCSTNEIGRASCRERV